MNKTWLIIKREYLTRVRKKSFIIMTLLGPILMAGLLMLVVWLGMQEDDRQKILVIDDTKLFYNDLNSNDLLQFDYQDLELGQAKALFHSSSYTAILHVQKNVFEKNAAYLYFRKTPSARVQRVIEKKLEKLVEKAKIIKEGIDPEAYYKVSTTLNINPIKFTEAGGEEKVQNDVAYVGFAFALIIYMFIFLYGIQVMRGVIEEKTSRIIEVIISSVKPFQLMIGKIIGVAMVGLTQFVLWVVFTSVISGVATTVMFQSSMDPAAITETTQMTPDMMKELQQEQFGSMGNLSDPSHLINRINFPLMLGMFLFYFLGGYLLYSALFAAIGSAADAETDTQQFMLPVTIPLIFSYILSLMIIENPEGPAAFWGSIIPLTSPIVMMVRVAIGFEAGDIWQLYLSMALLVLGFLFATWVAARIYRTGILMYGKKVSWKELFKWMRYS